MFRLLLVTLLILSIFACQNKSRSSKASKVKETKPIEQVKSWSDLCLKAKNIELTIVSDIEPDNKLLTPIKNKTLIHHFYSQLYPSMGNKRRQSYEDKLFTMGQLKVANSGPKRIILVEKMDSAWGSYLAIIEGEKIVSHLQLSRGYKTRTFRKFGEFVSPDIYKRTRISDKKNVKREVVGKDTSVMFFKIHENGQVTRMQK